MKKSIKILIGIIIAIVLIGLLAFIAFTNMFISKDEAKLMVANNMKADVNDIFFESIELDPSKNTYELDVYYQNNEYEYKLDAKNGNVVYTNFSNVTSNDQSTDDMTNTTNNANTSENSNTATNKNTGKQTSGTNTNEPKISMKEAKNIAVKDAKLDNSKVTFTKEKEDYEKNTMYYEIEFVYNDTEYEYEIDSNTGKILSSSNESIHH